MNNTTDLKSFNYLENGRITFSIVDTIKTVKNLDPGLYSLYKFDDFRNPEIIVTKETPSEIQKLIKYHFINKIETILERFYDKDIKEKVNKLNYNHKIGLILHGKQGTSKSSIIKHFYNEGIINQGALVFYFTDAGAISELWDFIRDIRKIQANPIILVLDEFDQFFKNNKSHEELFKIIMDGHLSIDNCIFLAATNYIDLIPKTLIDRPSRFKYCFEVEGLQEKELIYDILKESFDKVQPAKEIDIKKLSEESIGKTVDELKEIVLDNIMDIEQRVKANVNRTQIGFNTRK